MAKEGSNNNRGIHGRSRAGDPRTSEGIRQVNALAAPGGLLGDHTEGGARQDVPSDDPQNTFPFFTGGEKELLGQGISEGLKDDNYPSTPNPEFPGESGSKNAGPQGDQVAWDQVAPYRYPEFPADSNASKVGSSGPVPLT